MWGHPTLSLRAHLWDTGPPEQAGGNRKTSVGERGVSSFKEVGLAQRKLLAWKGQDTGAAHGRVPKETTDTGPLHKYCQDPHTPQRWRLSQKRPTDIYQ